MLTPESFALLRLLSAQEPCAGHKLANELGISKHKLTALIAEIEALGIGIERVSGKGYQLAHAIDWFNLDTWRTAILERGATPPESRRKLPPQTLAVSIPITDENGATTQTLPFTLQWFEQLDSTSNELMRRVPRHDVHGNAVITDWQSAGRGRRGRPWAGLPGGSLLFSLGWRFDQGGGFLSALPLAMSVAVVRALELEGYHGIQLKWPNDLVHRYQKLGGVLIELSGDALGPTQAVIGVGLNMVLPRRARSEITQAVTDLVHLPDHSPKVLPDRHGLLARIIIEMVRALTLYAKKGFVAFAPEWQHRHIYHNCAVRLTLPEGQTASGTVVGVDANGALVLDEGHTRTRYTAGEVSLRRLEK